MKMLKSEIKFNHASFHCLYCSSLPFIIPQQRANSFMSKDNLDVILITF